jgi:hypothetical protein
MHVKVSNHTIIVGRKGVNITVPAGKAFEFTNQEIADIEASQPDSLRDPKNETELDISDQLAAGDAQKAAANVTKSDTAKKAAGKGKKGAAAAASTANTGPDGVETGSNDAGVDAQIGETTLDDIDGVNDEDDEPL